MKREINYELINDLYMRWLNECDPFMQRKIKDDIIKRISPYELLIYSARFSFPFEAFRNIFSLNDLFETLKEMQRQGEDIKRFTNQPLLIKTPEEIITVSNFAKREGISEINNFGLIFKGSNVFEFGTLKILERNFHMHMLTI